MRPARYLMVDPKNMPCVWIIVFGHIERREGAPPLLRGVVLQRGPDTKNHPSETGTQDGTLKDGSRASGSWLLDYFEGSSWTEL